jgi:hypothetical protein
VVLILLVIATLATFLVYERQARAGMREAGEHRDNLQSVVQYFVVHEEGDRTAFVPEAVVRFALPEPMIKHTGAGGEVNFTVAPSLLGSSFPVKAEKAGYAPNEPGEVVVERGAFNFLSLRPISASTSVQTDPRLTSPSAPHLTKVYDSDDDSAGAGSWTYYSSVGDIGRRIAAIAPSADEGLGFRIEALRDEDVGINKSCRALRGRVDFSYSIPSASVSGANLLFYMIPMEETPLGREGLIEVGTSRQDDPRNATSPYRARYAVPPSHANDGESHRASLEFDFTLLPTAFYSIFGPRINEGSPHAGPAVMRVASVQIYSSDP